MTPRGFKCSPAQMRFERDLFALSAAGVLVLIVLLAVFG